MDTVTGIVTGKGEDQDHIHGRYRQEVPEEARADIGIALLHDGIPTPDRQMETANDYGAPDTTTDRFCQNTESTTGMIRGGTAIANASEKDEHPPTP